jgi:hypothetical protein
MPSNQSRGSLPPRTQEAAAAREEEAGEETTQAPPSPAAAPAAVAASHASRATPRTQIATCRSLSLARIPGEGCARRLRADEASSRALEAGALESAARKRSGEEAGSGSGGREATRDLAEERAARSLESSGPVVALSGVFVGVVAAAAGLGGADLDCLEEDGGETSKDRG